jgi:hypothetical protein
LTVRVDGDTHRGQILLADPNKEGNS